MDMSYPIFICSKDRVNGSSASYTVNVNADRILKDDADLFEVCLVRFFACSNNGTNLNQISALTNLTNFYQIQLSLAQPFNIYTGTSVLKNSSFLVPTVSCNNVPALIYSGKQEIVVSKASLANLLQVTIFDDKGSVITPVASGEHVMQLSFKPLR